MKQGRVMRVIAATVDLRIALSACPDLPVGGKPIDVMIYGP